MNNNINIDNNLVNLKDILDNKKVIVPIIQRGYAQGRTDVKATDIRDKFLDSIIKYLFNKKDNNDFILDIIYGVNDNNIFYPIDGQQRLTTLFLFHWYIYNCLKADRTFLSKFSYETRITSTDFLSLLNSNKINIDFDKDTISNQITSNISFLNYYRKDPTVNGILLVLDEIHKKIQSYIKTVNNKEDILKRLDDIKFFQLDIKGDYDDLYIKMNSRGKQLTDFEIFKSKLEKFLYKNGIINDKNGQGFDKKIDIDWTNFIWDFIKDKKSNDEGDKFDDLFMKLFSFIFEMLYYSQIEIVEDTRKLQIEKSNLEFFELFFSHIGDKEKKEYINKLKAIENNEEDKKIALKNNIEFIINIFDILSELRKDEDKLKKLFNDIFYHNNESKNDEDKYNKICTFDNNLNVFNNDDNLFEFFKNIEKRILIFFVFKILNYEYLKNEKNIKDINNIKNKYFNKLRLIRNLLYNTDNLYGNIYYQMKLIDKIITEDEFEVIKIQSSNNKDSIKNTLFTIDLIKSEKKKLEKLNKNDENINNNIYACENNVFLQGNINFILDYLVSSECNDNIVGIINHIFTEGGFNNENGNYLIHRAMLSFICKQQIIDRGTIDTSYMYKDYNIWNNKENDKKGFINFIKDISKKINDKNIKEDIKKSINEICQNIIDNPEKYMKDENDFRYLLIKDATDCDGNITNLFHSSNDKKLKNNILCHKKNVNIYDIFLNTNIYKILKRIQKHNREFNFYVFHPDNSIEESNDWYYLRYNNGEMLYLYSYLMFAYKLEKNDCYIGFLILKNIMYIGIIYDDNKKNNKMMEKVTKQFGEHWIYKRYISYKCFVLHYYNIFNNTIDDKELNNMIKELNKIKTFVEGLYRRS